MADTDTGRPEESLPPGDAAGGLAAGELAEQLARHSSGRDEPLAARAPGVRRIERTAAERYEVQPEYRRFDQQMNMTRQPFWRGDGGGSEAIWHARSAQLAAAGKPGYGPLDWGFLNAALANNRLAGFGINSPNRGPTSWRPVGRPAPAGAGRWSGDPSTNARAVKKIARLFGAGDVGITLLDRRWVYASWFDEATRNSFPIRFSDEPGYEHIAEPTQLEDGTQVIPAGMKYVAVFVLPMDRQGIAAAPTLTQRATTLVTYSAIGRLVASVAEFIRGLGYHAIPSANCTALSIPLAIDAGLGELGRNAKLIHPLWGPVCRICKVITDLPMEPDVPIATGATAFCESCGKCANACPGRAIPKGPRSFEPAGDFSSAGVRQWQLDHGRCRGFQNRVGTNCGICLRVCPFNKSTGWLHQMARAAIARFPAVDPLLVRIDDALGYGKPEPERFWA